jgi:hypothetical protein
MAPYQREPRIPTLAREISFPAGLAGDEGAMRSGCTADLTVAHGILESNIVVIEKAFTQEALLDKAPRILDGGRLAQTATAVS